MLLLLAASLPSLLGSSSPAPAGCTEAPAPKVNMRSNVARATSSPWVDSNAARYVRNPEAKYCVEAPGKSSALAAAEAFAYGVTAWIKSADGGAEFGRMLDFLKALPAVPDLPAMANIGVVDDGTPRLGEVLNLLSRRNLLFKVVKTPDPKLDVNVPGSQQADPSKEAYEIRQKLGDSKRLLRVYGSEVVIGHLTGDGSRVRLQLLNYSPRPVNGLRVRVLGNYPKSSLKVFGIPDAQIADFTSDKDGTEFTIQSLNEYAVVDLSR
ncbi:MAG TPA: hypothetical protein VNH18_00840 [Bryobacteraceae bacterium]|nr:hypothetical protein [Bryobacteraceae bacterium]